MQSSSVLNPAGFLLDQHHSSWIQRGSSNILNFQEMKRFFFKASSVKLLTQLGSKLNFGLV
jgi:hypothetical protein